MKSLMKAILTDLQAFDKHGAKSPQALEEQQSKLTENIDKFRQLNQRNYRINAKIALSYSLSAPVMDIIGGFVAASLFTVLHPAEGDRFKQADDNAVVLRGEIHRMRGMRAS